MEIKTLEYFVKVACEGNMSRAAEKLFVTQPNVTRQIQILEEELGKKLFERGKYSLKLTDDGFLLLKRAKEILKLIHETKIEFTADEIRGDVYIGCAESDSVKYFARAAKNVQKKYPHVHFNLYSGNFEDIYFRLDNGLLDFYITLQSVDVSKYESLILPAQDVWGLILRRDNPIANKKSFTVDDLMDLPLILSREGMREEYPAWFGNNFEKFNVVATYNLLYNAAIMVREGLGYAISIDKLINDAELCFRPLEPEFKSNLQFIWRKDRLLTPQAQILLDEMENLYSDKKIPSR